MKFFSQGPISRFDFGVAIVVLVLIIVLIYVYQLWKPSRWESVCQHQNSGKLDSMSEQKINTLCKARRNRETECVDKKCRQPVESEPR